MSYVVVYKVVGEECYYHPHAPLGMLFDVQEALVFEDYEEARKVAERTGGTVKAYDRNDPYSDLPLFKELS